MKLTLSHGDVIAGICAFLSGRGLTGFDPNKVHAEFTKGRDGKLSVVLDDEAPTGADTSAPKPKPAKADANKGTAASGDSLSNADKADAAAAEVPATGPVTAAQEEAQAEVEVAAEQPATEVAAEADPATPAETGAAGEENLFG